MSYPPSPDPMAKWAGWDRETQVVGQGEWVGGQVVVQTKQDWGD